MKRADGYYWVTLGGELEIGRYNNFPSQKDGYWVLMGGEFVYYDESFEEIDERRIVRQPNKQMI